MTKTVIVLNGVIINVGEWESAEPMPEGATIEEREMEYTVEYGWREVGHVPLPTDKERIEMLEETINFLLGL